VGYRIFLRTPVTERERIAITGIHEPFLDPPTPPAPLRKDALARADEAYRKLTSGEVTIEELQKTRCCAGVDSWAAGRGIANVEAAAKQLAIGEVSKPIDVGDAFRIVRRVAPPPMPKLRPIGSVLPKSAEPDFEELVRGANDPRILSAYIVRLEQVARELDAPLKPAQRELLGDLFGQLRADMRRPDPEERVAALRAFRAELQALLGPESSLKLRKRLIAQVTEDIAPELARAEVRSPSATDGPTPERPTVGAAR